MVCQFNRKKKLKVKLFYFIVSSYSMAQAHFLLNLLFHSKSNPLLRYSSNKSHFEIVELKVESTFGPSRLKRMWNLVLMKTRNKLILTFNSISFYFSEGF